MTTFVVPSINLKSVPKNLTAEKFNTYFANIPLKIDSEFDDDKDIELLWRGGKSIHKFTFDGFTIYDVTKRLQSLPDKTGNDIVGIDRRLLRIGAEYVSSSLTVILNKSLSEGAVDDDWKISRVTPVYKNDGDLNNENNYRPISVIGHVAKVLEQLVCSQLTAYLMKYKFISPDQSAYLPGHSTQTSLHRAVDDWLENINENQVTGAILLDVSKCFDTINHTLLLRKLEMYGISGTALQWFTSYLHNRRQSVCCHGKMSEPTKTAIGVPQGPVLGPFLFLLFINDVSSFMTNGGVTNLFADDNFIYACGDTIDEVKERLQKCLDSIAYWYKRNRLKINEKKTKIMLIGSKHQLRSMNLEDYVLLYDDKPLELVEAAKYLGLHISSDLSWDLHIQHLCKQMYYYISLFRRLSKILPRESMLKVYKAYIQPRFDYGVTVWGCTMEYNLDKVQRIQNLAGRIISNNFDYINFRGLDIVRSLHLPTIRERRDYFLCALTFKSIHGLAPTYLSDRVDMKFDVLGYNVRSTDSMDIYLPLVKRDMYKNSLLYRGGSLWNKLPDHIKESPNFETFKMNYRQMRHVLDS